MDDYLTFEQASELLNTPRSTLYRLLKEGRVPGHKLGRQWRFLRSELESFLQGPQDKETTATSPLGPLLALLNTLTPREHKMMTAYETLMWTAYDQGVTSIHLQPQASGSWELLQRKRSGLETLTKLSAEAFGALSEEIDACVPSESRGKSGARSAWNMVREDDHILVMHQHLPTALGPRLTFRLIRERPQGLTLDQITQTKEDLEALRGLIEASHGIVLVSGPSGSGKTTTAHTFLRELAKTKDRVIFTLEPSTEHLIPGVNQVAVDLDNESTYRQAFSQVMHSDPDVLFLSSTFAPRHRSVIYTTALNAAESGHLVFVQLEAESPEDAIERFQAQVERPVDDWVVGAVWQHLERSEDGKTHANYHTLHGPLWMKENPLP